MRDLDSVIDELNSVKRELNRFRLVPSRFFLGEQEVITTGIVDYLYRRRAELEDELSTIRKEGAVKDLRIAPGKEVVVRQACQAGHVRFELRCDIGEGVDLAQAASAVMTELARVLKTGPLPEDSPGGK